MEGGREAQDEAARWAKDRAIQFGACGATLALLLWFQLPFVTRVLTTSYADAYADWQRPLAERLIGLFDFAGRPSAP